MRPHDPAPDEADLLLQRADQQADGSREQRPHQDRLYLRAGELEPLADRHGLAFERVEDLMGERHVEERRQEHGEEIEQHAVRVGHRRERGRFLAAAREVVLRRRPDDHETVADRRPVSRLGISVAGGLERDGRDEQDRHHHRQGQGRDREQEQRLVLAHHVEGIEEEPPAVLEAVDEVHGRSIAPRPPARKDCRTSHLIPSAHGGTGALPDRRRPR